MFHFYFNILRRFMVIPQPPDPSRDFYTDEGLLDIYSDEEGNLYHDETEN